VNLEVHPEARGELRAAALWYETQRAGLGDEFVDEVTAVIAALSDAPNVWSRWPNVPQHLNIHRAQVERFPYAVAYQVADENLYVLAVAHQKRRPLYWLARASAG
jgi:toxin ParE1/3/4